MQWAQGFLLLCNHIQIISLAWVGKSPEIELCKARTKFLVKRDFIFSEMLDMRKRIMILPNSLMATYKIVSRKKQLSST